MFHRLVHFSCRVMALAAFVLPLISVGGCALFRKDMWNIDRYRDEQAVDIDHRLDHNAPIVKNPF